MGGRDVDFTPIQQGVENPRLEVYLESSVRLSLYALFSQSTDPVTLAFPEGRLSCLKFCGTSGG